jgi:thiosulfate/3-mercaptopyruvate sulfurtransferase
MSTFNTLIQATDLQTLVAAGQPLVVIDCSFDLADPGAGERAHAAGHIAGAVYAHLDRDLSGPKAPGKGRHPLPERSAFAATAGRLGVAPGVQVLTCDAQGGPYAARAWWLLRWMGHDDVAVLDGGLAAWTAAGGALTRDAPRIEPATYPHHAPAMPTFDAAELLAHLGRVRLIDARAGERFRGEVEPLDAAAGHIPGARNRCFKDNLGADGRFKSREALRAEWAPVLAGDAPVIHSCGSGVTACHNLLAVAHAGLGDGVLYPGSWSEWSSDPSRPLAQG